MLFQMITGFVLYLGETEWLIFQQSVEGREIGKGFYKWMETGPLGHESDTDIGWMEKNIQFNGR